MGIGGAGMSGLALLFKALGYNVSGCDMGNSSYTERVREAGIDLHLGHDACHLDDLDIDLLAYSSAIPPTNPELSEARRRGIPVVQRAELLSSLFNNRKGIGVAGTHGKTTTTSMISLILDKAGLSPTVAIGGELCDIGCNARLGEGSVMVAELDESDGSFEVFCPSISVVTNVDWDHVNHYPDLNAVIDAFERYLGNTDPGGTEILCGDDAGVRNLMNRMGPQRCRHMVTYGLGESNQIRADKVVHHLGGGASYTLVVNGVEQGEIHLQVSGEHNVLDSLAACAAVASFNVPFNCLACALSQFSGVKRRLQKRGEGGSNVLVYDDYGHHPNEIAATISALGHMYPQRRLVLVFQPHRYSRTAALFDQFAEVLSRAPQVVLLPIYAADEAQVMGVSSEMIQDSINRIHKGSCHLVKDKVDAADCVMSLLEPGDLVLTEGAGDVCVIGDLVLQNLVATEAVTA